MKIVTCSVFVSALVIKGYEVIIDICVGIRWWRTTWILGGDLSVCLPSGCVVEMKTRNWE